jgi:hypothetical protein
MLADRVCGGGATTPAGCSANQLCAPSGGTDFPIFCVAQTGMVTCLDTFYSHQHIVANGAIEGRSCAACTCGTATSTCGGSARFWEPGCIIISGTVLAGACAAVPANSSTVDYLPNPSGTCNPSVGMVMGDVTLDMPLTLCCNG